MPELPDVELFKRLAEKCVGRTVERAIVDDPGIIEGVSPAALQRRVKGARVGPVRRHGKHLLIDLSGAGCLAMHFGTNGSLRRVGPNDPDPPYVRLSLVFTRGDRLAYLNPRRIGNVQLAKDAESFIAEAALGPDALDRRFDLKAMQALFAGRKRDVKSILMDQELIAGIGNIYSDEILFQARIHPETRGDALDRTRIERLFAKTKQVLETAIAQGTGSEQAMERVPRGFLLRERHRGGHCPRCGTELATVKRSGRTSYYCPSCQTAP